MKRLSKYGRVSLVAALAAVMALELCVCVSADEVPQDVVVEAAAEPVVEEAVPEVPAAEPVPEVIVQDAVEEPVVSPEPEPVADAAVVEPVMDPAVVDPVNADPAADPAVVEPAVVDPVTADPAADPAVLDPAAVDPAVTDTVVEEPVTNAPVPAESDAAAEPVATARQESAVQEPESAVQEPESAVQEPESVVQESQSAVQEQGAGSNVTEPETGTSAVSADNYDVEGVSNSEFENYLWEKGMGEWTSSIDEGDGSASSYTWGLNTLTREPAQLKGYNFAIFGLSGENSGDNGRSDTIIICTIDPERKEIKLTSILRDTKASIEGHEPQKINAAHMIGGPELAIDTLNKNFGLTLKDYVTVKFETLMDIVDTVGGIEIELNQDEADFINEYSMEYGFPALTAGVQQLNGWQSVLYCRIRKIDSDKVRAGRQQTVIRKIFEKLGGAGFLQWFKIVVKVLETTTISMPLGNILEVIGLPLGEYSLVNYVVPDIEYETDLKTAIDEHGEWVWLYDLGKAGDRIVQIINNQ